MTIQIHALEPPQVWEHVVKGRSLLDVGPLGEPFKIPVGAEYLRWGAFKSPNQTTSQVWAGGTGGANLDLQMSMFETSHADAWVQHPDTGGNELTSPGYSGLVSAVGYRWARAVVSQTGATTENALIDVAFRLG